MKHILIRWRSAAWGVFIALSAVSATVAGLVWFQGNLARVQAHEVAAERAANRIEDEVTVVLAALKDLATHMTLALDPDGANATSLFHEYVDASGILENAPQIRGVGLSVNLTGDVSRAAADIDVWPDRARFGYGPLVIQPAPRDKVAAPLIAVAPRALARQITGFDTMSAPERRRAIDAARDEGKGALSSRITLATGVAGIVIVQPVYLGGFPVMTDLRDRQVFGHVTSAFRVRTFLDAVVPDLEERGLRFEIHDMGEKGAPSVGAQDVNSLVVNSNVLDRPTSEWVAADLIGADAIGAQNRLMSVGGRQWRLSISMAPDTGLAWYQIAAIATAFSGLVIAALAAFLANHHFAAAEVLSTRVAERTAQLQDTADALKIANDKIRKQADEDELTGLKNRWALKQVLQEVLSDSRQSGKPAALLHIDLDRFKQINDTLGHAGGDFVLRHVARLARAIFDKSVAIARVGGDEFVAVVSNCEEQQPILEQARALVDACRQPVDFEGRPCRFGASVGVAFSDRIGTDRARLMINADLALYRAKSLGRNRVSVFTEEMAIEIQEHKALADDMLRGLEANEFVAYFQPQFDAASRELVGAEALVRWHHPFRGLLAPSAFLAVAEDLGVVADIDRRVLDQSLEMGRWAEAAGCRLPKISTNLSFHRLGDADFMSSLPDLRLPFTRFSFEILESIFLDDDSTVATWNIDQMKEAGFGVELDDFGSGRTSVIALTKIGPDRMKIDRSLVAPIVERPERRKLVQSLVDIGRALDIGVTAEGVEAEGQAKFLRDIGCDVLQGFLFSEPLPVADFKVYLQSAKGSLTTRA
ncbi:MAG: EAL domain-containing protein [Pseudomonadota bacterium]